MTDSNKGKSVYFRTIIYLVLATIFIFGLLCVIYYQQTSQSIVSERSQALYSSAVSASDGYRIISKNVIASSLYDYLQEEVFEFKQDSDALAIKPERIHNNTLVGGCLIFC